MFSSLKKWVKNDGIQQKTSPPAGVKMMNRDLQKKFAKGVNCNLKIVIRGERNTGKTCLCHRLQGRNFIEEYIPTAEIQVSSIHWNYKVTDDIVKVDVWDIVDQGKSKKAGAKGLKIVSDSASSEKDELQGHALDATFIDVYKGAHAVIMMFDVTKKWTYSYIEQELPKVPSHLPVLVLANFRDLGDHRVVTLYELEGLVQSIHRPPGSPSLMFYESSMKNGFGLKYIHKFFNLPYLFVQRLSLIKRLETNHLELESSVEELGLEEHSYETYNQMLKDRSAGRGVLPSPSPTTHSQMSSEKSSSRENKDKEVNPVEEAQMPQRKKELVQASRGLPTLEKERYKQDPQLSMRSGAAENNFSKKNVNSPAEVRPKDIMTGRKHNPPVPVSNVDEFVPDDESVDEFLDNTADFERSSRDIHESSDDEEYLANPMVAGFQEDLDSDDQASISSCELAAGQRKRSDHERLPHELMFTNTKSTPTMGWVEKDSSKGASRPSSQGIGLHLQKNPTTESLSNPENNVQYHGQALWPPKASSLVKSVDPHESNIEYSARKYADLSPQKDNDNNISEDTLAKGWENKGILSLQKTSLGAGISDEESEECCNSQVSATYGDMSSDDETTTPPGVLSGGNELLVIGTPKNGGAGDHKQKKLGSADRGAEASQKSKTRFPEKSHKILVQGNIQTSIDAWVAEDEHEKIDLEAFLADDT